MLCGGGEEDEMHFVVGCASLLQERQVFARELRARLLESGHDLSHRVTRQVLQASTAQDESLYALVLGSAKAVQALGSSLEERRRKRRQRQRTADELSEEAILDAVSSVVWPVSANYLSAIWKRRCGVLGGVLLPNKQGAMSVEPVTKAFRCRTL